MSGPRVAILDYGMGNLRSVEKAFERVGARPELTNDRERIRAADGLVLPGVGAFPKAMERIRELRLGAVVRERVQAGVPVLGICLGMQLLFESSEEHEGERGLGLLAGRVAKLDTRGLKLPHIGWNMVRWQRSSALTEGLGEEAAFYHVHSYACRPADEDDAVGSGEYGETFCSIVERDNLFGVQFHPEKSSRDGLALLRNFARVCTRVAA